MDGTSVPTYSGEVLAKKGIMLESGGQFYATVNSGAIPHFNAVRLVLFVAAAVCSCDLNMNSPEIRDLAAQAAAEKWFIEFRSKADQNLGLTGSTIFGRTSFDFIPFGGSAVTLINPTARSVTIPFWCSAMSGSGEAPSFENPKDGLTSWGYI